MKETIIEELIKFFGIIGGACITVIKLGTGYFKLREKKLEEQSVGVTKVRELETVNRDILQKFKSIEESCQENEKLTREIRHEQREFTSQILGYFIKNKT